jgi:nitrogen fixation NifU-like protein
MDLYAENILDHYRSPHRKTAISDASVAHEEVNHSCGDAVTIQIKLKDGHIEDMGWAGTGCAISQAAMSMLSDDVIGKKEEDILKLSQSDVVNLLGVPIGPRRIKCALLSLHVLKNAILKSQGLEPQSWRETVG